MCGLGCEHGLSVYLEHRGRRLLLDAGHSDTFARNADALEVDLSQVDTAALSHGHWDHADGFDVFFARNDHAPVHARPAITQPEYHDGTFIGIKPELMERYAGRFALADGPTDLSDGIWLIPDQVPHEQSLVLDTDAGLVLFNSCSHAGAGPIARDIRARFPGRPIAAYVGGFHLMGRTGPDSLGVAPGIVKNLASWLLDELEVGVIYTGHCTGAPAFDLLREVGGSRVQPLSAGTVIQIE
jgi:7,8-dihydropterin-6-yl-methyl-4-(beta-D-ribofuranosyl)aminobenzene 5'-phosphate synthase